MVVLVALLLLLLLWWCAVVGWPGWSSVGWLRLFCRVACRVAAAWLPRGSRVALALRACPRGRTRVIIMTTWTTRTTWSSVTLGHVATSSTKIFLISETPLQWGFKTTRLTPVGAILRSGRCAVAPTGLVLPWHRGRRTAAAGPLTSGHANHGRSLSFSASSSTVSSISASELAECEKKMRVTTSKPAAVAGCSYELDRVLTGRTDGLQAARVACFASPAAHASDAARPGAGSSTSSAMTQRGLRPRDGCGTPVSLSSINGKGSGAVLAAAATSTPDTTTSAASCSPTTRELSIGDVVIVHALADCTGYLKIGDEGTVVEGGSAAAPSPQQTAVGLCSVAVDC
eukprot:COSAG01_NODE_1241_length_11085_cov_9.712361_17_plen_343_part_00